MADPPARVGRMVAGHGAVLLLAVEGEGMTFLAELKETKQYKAASSDNLYSLRLVTDNPMVMDLGKLPSDTVFEITVTIQE